MATATRISASGLYAHLKANPAGVALAGQSYTGTAAALTPANGQLPVAGTNGLVWRGHNGALRYGSRNGTRAKAARKGGIKLRTGKHTATVA